MPAASSSASIQAPDAPPSGVTARTAAPSEAAARAALRPLPPATATTEVGRWIVPMTTGPLTWWRRSTAGVGAMHTIM